MPPKAKFTKAEVVQAAIAVVRGQGADALTARALGAQLGSSARPVFTVFQSMEEVRLAVLIAADELYQQYIKGAIQGGEYPAYKASGMAYIKFAKEEPELFKLLYMRDRSVEPMWENKEALEPLIDIICQNTGLDRQTAWLLHLEMWVYVHGIATMIATRYLDWDMAFVSRALSDCYLGLKKHFGENNTDEE